MALEAPRPYRSKRRLDPPLASKPGLRKQLELRRIAPHLHPHRRAPSRTRGRDGVRFETPPSMKAFASLRDAPNFQANNPLFKERVPELHVAYRSRGLSPSRPANVAFHDASLASDCACSRGGRHVAPTPRANRLSSDVPFGSFPAGPHERYRRSTTRSAFHRWAGAVRPSRVSSLELGTPFRRGHDHDERERTRHCSPTSATDVKVEHTRERPVTPPPDAS
jgi:hypothetical protein